MSLMGYAGLAGLAIVVIVALWFIVCLLFSIGSKLDNIANSLSSILAGFEESTRQKKY